MLRNGVYRSKSDTFYTVARRITWQNSTDCDILNNKFNLNQIIQLLVVTPEAFWNRCDSIHTEQHPNSNLAIHHVLRSSIARGIACYELAGMIKKKVQTIHQLNKETKHRGFLFPCLLLNSLLTQDSLLAAKWSRNQRTMVLFHSAVTPAFLLRHSILDRPAKRRFGLCP